MDNIYLRDKTKNAEQVDWFYPVILSGILSRPPMRITKRSFFVMSPQRRDKYSKHPNHINIYYDYSFLLFHYNRFGCCLLNANIATGIPAVFAYRSRSFKSIVARPLPCKSLWTNIECNYPINVISFTS